MYLYLYDSWLNQKRYHQTLARIETRLTDLGIGGKIARLSPLRNLQELITDEIQNGIKTVVVVGNDCTVNEVVNIVAKEDIVVGIIPIGDNNHIAKHLGIPEAENACSVLAARIIEKIDLGKVNNGYFLSGIKIAGDNVTLECENQYRIRPSTQGAEITICNFRPALAGSFGQNNYFDPQDGSLEIFIRPLASGFINWWRKKTSSPSIIPFKKIAIDSKQTASVITEGQKVLKTPIKIEIASKKLEIIVGKQRIF